MKSRSKAGSIGDKPRDRTNDHRHSEAAIRTRTRGIGGTIVAVPNRRTEETRAWLDWPIWH